MQLTWIIRSFDDFQVFDEFVVERFRLRLSGTLLTVEAELVSDDAEQRSAASALAYRYFAALRQHVRSLISLMTLEEYAAIEPPFSQKRRI